MLFNEVDEFIRNFESTDKFDNADVNFEKFINFLKTSSVNCIPLMVDHNNIQIISLIISKKDLPKNYIEDLKKEINNFNFDTFGKMYYSCERNQLVEPCDGYRPNFLEKSTPPFLNKKLSYGNRSNEYDINQKISYSLNIHKKGDCKFPTFYIGNKEVAKIIKENNIEFCTINKEEVEKFLKLSNSILIRYFFVQFRKNNPNRDLLKFHKDKINMDTDKIYYEYTEVVDSKSEKSLGKEIRGFQLID